MRTVTGQLEEKLSVLPVDWNRIKPLLEAIVLAQETVETNTGFEDFKLAGEHTTQDVMSELVVKLFDRLVSFLNIPELPEADTLISDLRRWDATSLYDGTLSNPYAGTAGMPEDVNVITVLTHCQTYVRQVGWRSGRTHTVAGRGVSIGLAQHMCMCESESDRYSLPVS